MKEEIFNFIKENNLMPFNEKKTIMPFQKESIYKTRDAKNIHSKVLQNISKNFIFKDTTNLLNFFKFTNNQEEILKRQEFFKNIKSSNIPNNKFLSDLIKPLRNWKPQYDVIVVTEDIETFNELKKMNCPVQLIISEMDVALLESRDIVQIIDCPEFGIALESLPQSVFLKNIDEVYLERHLEIFSGWVKNLKIIEKNQTTKSIQELTNFLKQLIPLTNENEVNTLDRDEIESLVIEANRIISEEIQKLTLSGMSVVEILSHGTLPPEIKKILENSIERLNIPRQILEIQIPLKVNEEELEKLINEQSKIGFTSIAEKIKENSNELKDIPEKLNNLSENLIFFDFISGINKYMEEEYIFPKKSTDLLINNSKNMFLEKAVPISFELSEEIKCSILTGANSGGKTTLIEHIIQLISLFQLGLPVSGEIKIPLFEEIYYFAKNKGSNLKGAFETLLTQMSKIKPGNKTLILADEIEAVTEPGVAGNIIVATSEYYLRQNCFLIVATHLGHEIQKILPIGARIDGIEATGLDSKFNLIVNHNPVLGRLAHSTPELIVEKMANLEDKEYFKFLNEFLKNKE